MDFMDHLPKDIFDVALDENLGTPHIWHRATGMSFRHIPAGTFRMGLSDAELVAAGKISSNFQASVDELRPVRQRSVESLLIAASPVLNRHMGELTNADEPAWFERQEAVKFCTHHGLRMPHEHEWEYACRAGSTSLFAFGDVLPEDDELARWLSSDFSLQGRPKANAFHLNGLYEPQWCEEVFRIDLRDGAPILDGSYAIRGGGAYFWPWQDDEWVWCMSSMRSPASGLEDGRACLRPVFDIQAR